MCMDIGKISQEEDSAKMGICIDQSNQNGLAGLFAAGMGGAARGQGDGASQRPGAGFANLDAFAEMTMVFEKAPKNVSAYVDPVCAARARVFEASSRRLGGAPALWLAASCIAAALASGFPLSFA
jgi:hypothetical protein